MVMNDIVTAISTVGFPIAMSLLLFWNMREMNENHKVEIKEMTAAIDRNTLVVQKLSDKLGEDVEL